MTFISHAVETALTRLTQQLIAHQTDRAVVLVCAQGEFYRAELRLEPIKPSALGDYLAD